MTSLQRRCSFHRQFAVVWYSPTREPNRGYPPSHGSVQVFVQCSSVLVSASSFNLIAHRTQTKKTTTDTAAENLPQDTGNHRSLLLTTQTIRYHFIPTIKQ
ncbi:unnamed protein product [Lactuca virosa]|uniref:Uncharacterized protein n=1 Tax=Lactuca virosa TaxID=75947 RepID=A0AAU9P4P2_9ASTR|nr:unnamed protein product [Lactuca virosa]